MAHAPFNAMREWFELYSTKAQSIVLLPFSHNGDAALRSHATQLATVIANNCCCSLINNQNQQLFIHQDQTNNETQVLMHYPQ